MTPVTEASNVYTPADPADSQQNLNVENGRFSILKGTTLAGAELVVAPASGVVHFYPTDGSFTYRPDTGYVGQDSFQVATDAASEDVIITISKLNRSPVVLDARYVVRQDLLASLPIRSMDLDGDTLTYTITTSPTNGIATLNGDKLDYTPNSGFNGDDLIEITADDGTVTSSAGSITIMVRNLADVKTVYNAAGDGATDDSAAITNAISQCKAQGYDGIYFPEGTYMVSTTLTIPSQFFFAGSGDATIESSASSGNIVAVNKSGRIYINWLGFKGIKVQAFYHHGSISTVENCVVTDGIVHVKGSYNVITRNNELLREAGQKLFGSIGLVAYNNKEGVEFTNNLVGVKFSMVRYDDSGYLNSPYGHFQTGINLVNYDKGVKIIGNYFINNPATAVVPTMDKVDHAIYFKSYENIEFAYNTVYGWPQDSYGGAKLRNTVGLGYFHHNFMHDTAFLAYNYDGHPIRSFDNHKFNDNIFYQTTEPPPTQINKIIPVFFWCNDKANPETCEVDNIEVTNNLKVNDIDSTVQFTRFHCCSSPDDCNFKFGGSTKNMMIAGNEEF